MMPQRRRSSILGASLKVFSTKGADKRKQHAQGCGRLSRSNGGRSGLVIFDWMSRASRTSSPTRGTGIFAEAGTVGKPKRRSRRQVRRLKKHLPPFIKAREAFVAGNSTAPMEL